MNKQHSQAFNEVVNHRRAVRIYDEKLYNPESVTVSLKRALLSPSSSNMQLWEFYRVSNSELKKKLAWCCLNQNAAKTAQELVVVVIRPDLWKSRAATNYRMVKENMPERTSLGGGTTLNYYKRIMPILYRNDVLGILGQLKKIMQFFVGLHRPTVREVSKQDLRVVMHKSAALAAQTFMLSMSAEGHDTCPMEGFDSKRAKKALGLPASAEINMIISCGIRVPEGIYGPRLRVNEEEVLFHLK